MRVLYGQFDYLEKELEKARKDSTEWYELADQLSRLEKEFAKTVALGETIDERLVAFGYSYKNLLELQIVKELLASGWDPTWIAERRYLVDAAVAALTK